MEVWISEHGRNTLIFLSLRVFMDLFILGTNGEGPLLSFEEKKELLKIAVEVVQKRVPVISQVGGVTTKEAVELAKYSIEVGVDAVAALSHYYFKLSDEAIFSYFDEIASSVSPTPFFVYNIPQYTGNPVKESVLLKLREKHENFVGIKDSEQSLLKIMDYKMLFGENFIVMTGTDSLIAPSILMGADGAVSAIADALPEFCVKLFEVSVMKEVDEAKKMQYKLLKLRDFTKSMSDSRAVLKYILQKRSIFKNCLVRSPLKNLSVEEKRVVDEKLLIEENGDFKIV
jgi:dihydrodipicolinate synthase/N-acetylneuraminate lyase